MTVLLTAATSTNEALDSPEVPRTLCVPLVESCGIGISLKVAVPRRDGDFQDSGPPVIAVIAPDDSSAYSRYQHERGLDFMRGARVVRRISACRYHIRAGRRPLPTCSRPGAAGRGCFSWRVPARPVRGSRRPGLAGA